MPNLPRGYFPPFTSSIPDDICLAIHVPNDPYALMAFWGAYEELGKWTGWAATGDTRARDIAARFKSSIALSRETFEQYGDLCTLQINVNCGCCNGAPLTYTPLPDVGQVTPDQAAEIVVLPPDLVDDGITPPTLSFADYESYSAWKCQVATRLADDILETFNRLGGLGVLFTSVGAGGLAAFLTAGSLSSAFVGALAAFLTPVGAVALIIGILAGALLAGIRALQYFHEIRDLVPRDELICLLYSAHDPQAARLAFMDRIAAAYPSVSWEGSDQTVFQEMFESLMDAVAPDELFAMLFELISDYDTGGAFDCSGCGPAYQMTLIHGTEADGVITAASYPAATDSYSYGRVDVYFGEYLGAQLETNPPHATVTQMVLSNWHPDATQQYNIRLYRPAAAGGTLQGNQPSDFVFPVSDVFRILMTARRQNPFDQTVEDNAVFTADFGLE